MNPSELARVAGAMVAKGKGILAADESTGTIKKRFDSIRLESTEEHRRTYREMLFTTAGAADSVSGVILYDETIRQKTKDGTPFPQYLARQGMIPGIKVDLGAKPLAGFPGETITEGLDGLRERLIEYRTLGARFAKWRAVIDIADAIPSAFAIEANAQALARYAALCQENDIVPIVEPEVLMDGAHTLDRCAAVTERVRVRFERERGGSAIRDVDDRAPFGKARAERAVLDEPLAQPIQPLGDGLAGKVREGLRAEIDLDARDHALPGEILRERCAVPGFLAKRLIVHDDRADRFRGARGAEQQLAIDAVILRGRLEVDAVEALLDGAGAFVGRQEPFALGHHRAGNARELARVHEIVPC